jgi:predicted nucleic acid-binding Zn ribbon protein
MGRGVLSQLTIRITALICISIPLYSFAASADAACSCSSSALECHGDTPVLQQQLIDQLGSCTATSAKLKQQLLRQQHYTPVVIALLDSSSMWQLLACAALLMLCLLSIAQVMTRHPAVNCSVCQIFLTNMLD